MIREDMMGLLHGFLMSIAPAYAAADWLAECEFRLSHALGLWSKAKELDS